MRVGLTGSSMTEQQDGVVHICSTRGKTQIMVNVEEDTITIFVPTGKYQINTRENKVVIFPE